MKQFILVIACFFSVKGFSQITFAYSGQIGMFSPQTLLPVNDGSYIGFKTISSNLKGNNWNNYRESVSFVKYDRDFKQVNEAKMTASGGICNKEFFQMKKAGNRFWFIYLETKENKDFGHIKAVEVDPNTLQQKEEKTLIESSSINFALPNHNFSIYFDFVCDVSPSGKYTYIYIHMSYYDNYMACFDEEMKMLWGRKNNKPDGEICSVEIDDFGNFYMGIKSKKGIISCNVYSPSGQLSSTNVHIDAGKVWDIVFHPAIGSEQIIVTGTYTEDNFCSGVYKGVLNKKGEIRNVLTTAIPESIVESMNKEGFANNKSKKFGLHPAYFSSAVKNKDGSSSKAMIMEFRREVGGGATGVSTNLHGGSLIYVDYSNDSPVFTRVPKYSAGRKPIHYAYNGHYQKGCMYFATPVDAKLIVLYFDNPENLNRDPALDAKIVNPKNGTMVAAVISKNGEMKRQRVSVQTITGNGIPVPATGTMLVPTQLGINKVVVAVKL